jgi:guanyl-specific ribonuclease Sa
MRNAFIAAAFAAPLLLLNPTPSMAQDIDLNIGIGEPDYYEDDYLYRRRGRVGCREARLLLRDRGYYRITTLDCGGPVHRFRASRRGNRYLVSVSRRGRVWRE